MFSFSNASIISIGFTLESLLKVITESQWFDFVSFGISWIFISVISFKPSL